MAVRYLDATNKRTDRHTKTRERQGRRRALKVSGLITGLMLAGCGDTVHNHYYGPDAGASDTVKSDKDSGRDAAAKDAMTDQPASGMKDCGADMECLVTASKTCEPTSVDITITIDFTPVFPFTQKTDSHMEIQGLEGGLCKFYLRTDGIELIFEPEVPQEQVDESQAMAQKLVGRDGTCLFTIPELTALLTRWANGSSSTEDFDGAECTGSYFSTKL
jgi:hypothetical protein